MKTTQSEIQKARELARDSKPRIHLFEGEFILRLLDDLESLQNRVKDADKQLDFYGDPETYILRKKDSWDYRKPIDDKEIIRNYSHPGTDWVGTIFPCGKRAREYNKRLKNK